MIGDDESKVEYQNRCARHAEFYEGCGPCTGNATEEFLLERNYQQHAKQITESEGLKERSDELTESIEQLGGFVVGPPMSIQEFADVVKQGIEHSKKLNEAVKDDDNKPRYDLLPPNALSELVAVYTMGAKKYAPRNWEKGLRWGRVFAALMRHAWAWWGGEKCDKESGLNHMAHVAWCALALVEYGQTNKGQDDRPVSESVSMSPYIVKAFDNIGVMRVCTTFVDRDEAVSFASNEITLMQGGRVEVLSASGIIVWKQEHE